MLLEMIDHVGRRIGIGPDHVKFELVQANGTAPQRPELDAADLPPHPAAMPGTLPRVGVGLTAPLFLRSKSENGMRQGDGGETASGMNSALRTSRGGVTAVRM